MKTFCYWFHTHPLGGKADSVVKLWSESQKHRPSEKQHLPDYHLLLVYPLPWRRASQPWPWRRWTSLWGLLHQRIHWTRFSQDYEYSDDDDNEEIVYEYEYEEEEAPLTTLSMEVEEHEDYEEEPAIRQKTKEWKCHDGQTGCFFTHLVPLGASSISAAEDCWIACLRSCIDCRCRVFLQCECACALSVA